MQITDPALATVDAGLCDACCTLPWRMMFGTFRHECGLMP